MGKPAAAAAFREFPAPPGVTLAGFHRLARATLSTPDPTVPATLHPAPHPATSTATRNP